MLDMRTTNQLPITLAKPMEHGRRRSYTSPLRWKPIRPSKLPPGTRMVQQNQKHTLNTMGTQPSRPPQTTRQTTTTTHTKRKQPAIKLVNTKTGWGANPPKNKKAPPAKVSFFPQPKSTVVDKQAVGCSDHLESVDHAKT